MMKSAIKTLCPVCGFDLGFEAWDSVGASDEICPCCGIQFGYDDMAGGDIGKRSAIYELWRQKWLGSGTPWRSHGAKQPAGWDPHKQLQRLKEQQ